MIVAVVKIILGLFIWRIVPGWIEFGTAKARSFVQLCLNIIGIVIVISGIISLLGVLGINVGFLC